MTAGQLFRLAGVAVVAGSALAILSSLIGIPFYGDMSKFAHNPLFLGSQLLNVLAAVLFVLGLPGVYARRLDGFGALGLVGTVLIIVTALAFPFFFALSALIFTPFLADKAPHAFDQGPPPTFFILFIVGGLSFVIGSALWALRIFQGRVGPRWAGFVLAAAAVLQIVSFPLQGNNLLTSAFEALPGILLTLGIAGVAYSNNMAERGVARVGGGASLT